MVGCMGTEGLDRTPNSKVRTCARLGKAWRLGKARAGAHTAVATGGAVTMRQRFDSFVQFYPFYLREHSLRGTRRLHFLGSSLGLACLVGLAVTGNLVWLLAALVCGYGFAWAAHMLVEKNRPATFRHPIYSFMGDWVMFWHMLRRKIPF